MIKYSESIYFLKGLASANIGIIKNDGEVALIDAGWTEESVAHLLDHLKQIDGLKSVKYAFLTHGDYDHVGGAKQIREKYGAKIVVHEDEIEKLKSPLPPVPPTPFDIAFNKEEEFCVGGLKLRVIPTPGHCSGSACVYLEEEKALFSGDTIVSKHFDIFSVYRYVKLPLIRDIPAFNETLKKLGRLDIKWIFPGHGDVIENAMEHINTTLKITESILETSLELFKERLTPRELAERLEVFPLLANVIIQHLESERKIEKIDEKIVLKEPVYIRKTST